MNTEDAIAIILESIDRSATPSSTGRYGYDVYIPETIRRHLEDAGVHQIGYLDADPRMLALYPVFMDAAWQLCLRGILRPGITRLGLQPTDEGSAGLGFSVSVLGRERLNDLKGSYQIPLDSSRFADTAQRLATRLGQGFKQRSIEAANCHRSGFYLASCAMSGAAAESVLLAIAIEKSGDEARILSEYRTSRGRSKLENEVNHGQNDHVKRQIRILTDLIKYWRDEASHGIFSRFDEYEAFEALSRLLRLANYAFDHWEILTTPSAN